MAYADYWLCDVCRGKSFYDANLNWDYAIAEKSQRPDGRLIPCGAGDMAAICCDCAITHEVVVVRQKARGDGE